MVSAFGLNRNDTTSVSDDLDIQLSAQQSLDEQVSVSDVLSLVQ